LRGFTLVELVMVIGIVALLASVVVPRFTNSLVRQRADAAARRVMFDLGLAQRAAQQSSSGQRVVFDAAASSYRLVGLADQDRPSGEYVVRLGELPYEATIVSANFGGDATLVFDGYGTPDSSGSVVVRVGNELRSVVLAADSGQVSITEALAAMPG
jgi:prepilin-type N-terminal cleavage/methylation domain-containing protein